MVFPGELYTSTVRATNNKAFTVALIFREAFKLYGWSSLVLGNCGVENVDVAR